MNYYKLVQKMVLVGLLALIPAVNYATGADDVCVPVSSKEFRSYTRTGARIGAVLSALYGLSSIITNHEVIELAGGHGSPLVARLAVAPATAIGQALLQGVMGVFIGALGGAMAGALEYAGKTVAPFVSDSRMAKLSGSAIGGMLASGALGGPVWLGFIHALSTVGFVEASRNDVLHAGGHVPQGL